MKTSMMNPGTAGQPKGVYNVLNASTNIRYNDDFGSQWQVPNLICGGRLLKFSGQLDF